MIQYYFQLQIKILDRRMKAFGLHPIIGAICAPFFFILISWFLFQKLAFSEYIYPVIPLYLIFMNNNRLKSRFMKSYFTGQQNLRIRIVENVLLSIPFIIFLLFKRQIIASAILIILSIAVAILNPSRSQQTKLPTPFSRIPFEFPIGFRKSLPIILVAIIILVIAIRVQNFNLGVVILGFLFLLPLGYYAYVEPKYYIQIFKDRPSQFLVRKIRTAIIFSLGLTIPFSLILGLFFPSYYLIILIVNVIGVLLISMSIIAKYSSYPKSMSIMDSIMFAISIVIPPLLLFTIPRLYKKSVKHLTPVLG